MSSNRIDRRFALLRERSEKALIGYLTVGYPTLEESPALIEAALESGLDLLELGVPFSDPVADGPTIQEAGRIALEQGVTLRRALQQAADLHEAGFQQPILLMSYFNPLMQYGLKNLAEAAATNGVDGFIVPDLPLEDCDEFKAILQARDLRLILLAAPTTDPKRLDLLAEKTGGFLYCVSIAGVTGARTDLPPDIANYLKRVREHCKKPLGVGFGISTGEQAKSLAPHCDGVIVGSALLKAIQEGTLEEKRRRLIALVRELKAGLAGK